MKREKKVRMLVELQRYNALISGGESVEAVALDMQNSINWGRNWKEQARKVKK